jgi:anti-anti-sigma factor
MRSGACIQKGLGGGWGRHMPTDWSDNIAIAELLDEPALSDELATLIQRAEKSSGKSGGMPHVVLNFAAVTYMNSSNLGQLLRLRKLLADAGRQMRLCSVNQDVFQILMVTGLDKVFRFAPDPLTALAGLQMDGAER